MPDPKRTIVVIPARGGSKRLPRKNVLPLGGKPLILHAVDVALAAAPFGRVMVSTEDPEIKTVALSRAGVGVDDRADILAGDKVKVVDVISELVDRDDVRANFDVIGMMLPTFPFRTPAHVREGFDGLGRDFDAALSFMPYDFSPQSAVTFDADGAMQPIYDPSPLITGNTRSQDQAPTYRPSGAFYFSWIESFRRLRSFFTGRVRGVTMPPAIDIDNAQDFEYAQFLIERGYVSIL